MTSKGYDLGPVHTPKDDGWGLSWSERWHFIRDVTKSRVGYGGAMAVCGSTIYTQPELREQQRPPAHLKAIVDGKRGAQGTCKKCLRWIEKDET